MARYLGAWALGFVFAPSPRRLAPAAARVLIDGVARTPRGQIGPPTEGRYAPVPAPLSVGVFGDVPAAEIARVVEQAGLDAVQLHGESGPGARSVREALAGWKSPLRLAGGHLSDERPLNGREFDPPAKARGAEPGSRGVLIIQAVPVAVEDRGEEAVRDTVERAFMDADLVLLDTRMSGRFGGTGTPFPWRLAREPAVDHPLLVAGGIDPGNVRKALEESSAWGVDVSSGVETAPGIKDAELVKSLFAQVAMTRRAATRGDDEHEPKKGPLA